MRQIKGMMLHRFTGERHHTRYYANIDDVYTAIERLAKKHGFGGAFGPSYFVQITDRDRDVLLSAENVTWRAP